MFCRKPKIFVQIASYRDPELQPTINSLFAKAKYPERIFLGICNQVDRETDRDFFEINHERSDQIRIMNVPAAESRGVCWARYMAQKLYRNEDYVLMIDSHMRFIPGWDEALIAELKLCRSKKPIISHYPCSYTPPDNLNTVKKAYVLVPKPYTQQGDIRLDTKILPCETDEPLKGAFIAGGFFFSRGEVIKEVPYDPHMYFNQEEITLSARLYTHGWDTYSPRKNLIHHMYIKLDGPRNRRLYWEDKKDWSRIQNVGRKRCDYLLGYDRNAAPEILVDIDRYGLGKERSLEQYQDYCGIDFSKRHISQKAFNAGFVEGIEKYLNRMSA